MRIDSMRSSKEWNSARPVVLLAEQEREPAAADEQFAGGAAGPRPGEQLGGQERVVREHRLELDHGQCTGQERCVGEARMAGACVSSASGTLW